MSSHSEDLEALYPGTTIVQPSCGANATYVALRCFGKGTEKDSLQSIHNLLSGGDVTNKSSSFLTSRDYLQSHDLAVLGAKIDVAEFQDRFESVLAILHTGEGGELSPGLVSHAHYITLLKNGNN